jgi:hypothetical protein
MNDNQLLEFLATHYNTPNQAGQESSGAAQEAARLAGLSADESRRHQRTETSRGLIAFPVRPDLSLDRSQRLTGSVIDVSEGGLGLDLDLPSDAIARTLIVGVETADGRMRFAGLEIRHARPLASTRKRIGAKFGGPAHQLLQAPVLTPVFDPRTMQYRLPVDVSVLAPWIEAGVFTPRLLDRVLVCPRCGTLPTFRSACRACKSGRVERERLMHHFACAHVDRVEAFTRGNELACPKCLRRHLVVGADFDYQPGPVICGDCGWSDSEAVQVGHCLRCGFRFTAEQAKEQQLVGYDAQRLDVLALLAAS